jgi:hypothetical protein
MFLTFMPDIASLIQQLYSDEENARRDATFDLIGGGGAVIEPLLPVLAADNADVRYAAALVLDQLKHLVSPRLFADVETAVRHLASARRRLNERSMEDDKFVAVVIRQILVRINTESARQALL